jgi:hypothetical protein
MQRRERAELIQERGRRKRDLTIKLSDTEKIIDTLEAEEKELVAKMESPDWKIDYAATNRRLTEIHEDLPKALHEWETVSKHLEKLLAEPLTE